MRLTQRTVEAMQVTNQDVVYWDDIGRFGLRVRPSGVKSYVVHYRNAQDRQRKLTIGQHGVWSLEQARERAKELLRKVDMGEDPAEAREEARSAITIEALCREYADKMDRGRILGRSGKGKKPHTVYTDKGRIERHIIPLLGGKLARDITKADVVRFRDAVADGHTKADVKTKLRGRAIVEGGSGTARRTMGLLGGIFTYAIEYGYITNNPVRGIRRPADNKRKSRLDADQYRSFQQKLQAAEKAGAHWQAIKVAQLLALTGLRKGEAVKLKLSEVDYKARCLRLGDTKTGESVRPLGEAAIRLLKGIEPLARYGYVFPVKRGSDKPYAGLEKVWRRALGNDLTPHTLRHSFASVANDLGLTKPTIGALLGHSSQGVTEGYIHHLDIALVAAADKVSGSIADMMG
jgi:integrase